MISLTNEKSCFPLSAGAECCRYHASFGIAGLCSSPDLKAAALLDPDAQDNKVLAVLQPGITGAIQLHFDVLKDPKALHPTNSLSAQTNDLMQGLCLKSRLQDTVQE